MKPLQQENQPKPCEISIIQHPGPPFGNPSGCSGFPGWAVRGQRSPRLSALPGPAPGALAQPGCSLWAPKLGLGRLPGAASPTFSWQEGGGGEHFLLCTDSSRDVITVSYFGWPPRAKVQPRAGRGRADGGARRGSRCIPGCGIYSPGPDHLTPCPLQWLSTAGAISPRKRQASSGPPRTTFPAQS